METHQTDYRAVEQPSDYNRPRIDPNDDVSSEYLGPHESLQGNGISQQSRCSVDWEEWLLESGQKLQENGEKWKEQNQQRGDNWGQRLRGKLLKLRLRGHHEKSHTEAPHHKEHEEETVDREALSYLALEANILNSHTTGHLKRMPWLDSHLSSNKYGEGSSLRPIPRSSSEVILPASENRQLWSLMDLMVEVAFPRCAICRLTDAGVSSNVAAIAELRSGVAYRRDAWSRKLTAGSRAEGLALESNWGHPPADTDIMFPYGGSLGVYMPEGHSLRQNACLEYHCERCPPAYCRLEVTEARALKKYVIRWHTHSWWQKTTSARRCIHRSGERHWLDTFRTVRVMKGKYETVSGPARQRGLDEYVTALVCSEAHPNLEREFRQRSRGHWPPTKLIEDILQLPMLLVLVGHKHSRYFKRQARISFSHCEIRLIRELSESVRQGYISCKYTLKRFLAAHRRQTKAGDGRSRVGSYHIKTVLLHYLEKTHPHMITSPFRFFVDLLHELNHYIEMGKLPHYFLAECDLLETVNGEERHIARQAIQGILSDPLTALLTSPIYPQQIYGEVHPDVLVNRFQRIANHPACEQTWKDLSVLLARLDECRQQRYQKHEWDERNTVYGRPGLIGLVDKLKQIQNS